MKLNEIRITAGLLNGVEPPPDGALYPSWELLSMYTFGKYNAC